MKKRVVAVIAFLANPEFAPIERRLLRALYLAVLAWAGVKGVQTA